MKPERKSKRLPFGLRMAKIGFERSKEPIPVGAAWLDGGRITIACNARKSSPAIKASGYKFEDSLHAEFRLFPYMVEVGSRSIVYIYRALKDGSLVIARPCSECMKVMRDYGVKRIVYTVAGGWQKEKI